MIEKLYTVEEVAELASVTGRTIRNYLKSGRLVGRKIGGQWRFPEAEVQRLLNGGASDDDYSDDDEAAVNDDDVPGGDFSRGAASEDGAPSREGAADRYMGGYRSPAPLPRGGQPAARDDAPAHVPAAERTPPAERPRQAPAYETGAGPASSGYASAGYAGFEPPASRPLEAAHNPALYPTQPAAVQPAAQPGPYAPSSTSYAPASYAAPSQVQAPLSQPFTMPASGPAVYATAGQTMPAAEAAHSTLVQNPAYVAAPTAQLAPGAFAVPQPGVVYEPVQMQALAPGQLVTGAAGVYPPVGTAYAAVPPAQPTPAAAPGQALAATPAGAASAAPALPEGDTSAAPAADEKKPEDAADAKPAVEDKAAPLPELSDVGKRVARFIAEVHDCSHGPQMCTVIDLHQSLSSAKLTSERLANIADEESESGVLCQSYVEFDERFFIARYTLFGTTPFLMRCLKLIG